MFLSKMELEDRHESLRVYINFLKHLYEEVRLGQGQLELGQGAGGPVLWGFSGSGQEAKLEEGNLGPSFI